MGFGLSGMDAEHRRLVTGLDNVCLALHGRNLGAAGHALADFIDIMTGHFSTEEDLLRRMGGDAAEHHLAVHRMTAELTENLRIAIEVDRSLERAEFLAAELVTQWIRRLFHEDAALAERIKALGEIPA
ncbi:hemerythrin domain-containing protein [Paramagnetospirillum marisnigri]|nr:hemerythrin domain-containing protein [Paramagnetospirillum marisnigri]